MKSLCGVLCALSLLVACSDSTGTGVGGGGNDPDPTSSDLGSMGVGDVRVLTFSAASGGLTIPASLPAAQYALILSNTNVATGSVTSYGLHGDWLVPSGKVPAADVLAPLQRPLVAPVTMSRGEKFEAGLRKFERTRLPRPGGRSVAGSSVAANRMVPRPSGAVNPPPAVGSTLTFKVLSEDGFDGVSTSACSATGFTSTVGTVKYVSQHAIVVSDVTSPAGGFDTADFKAIGDEFDQSIYPTDVSYFGTPTDLDNNGHIFIYYTPAVNKLTPAGQANVSGYVGGFFFAGDLYPPTSAGCLSSNQSEIFYLLAPDPNGLNGNVFTTEFVRQITRGTVAHEFQHMINSGNRFISPTAENFEATWLDEGLAHFAEDAVGRAEAGFADNTAVGINDVLAIDTTITQAFFLQNLARAKFYVERPDTTGAIVGQAKASANLASRGAEWALVRYLADWFDTGNDPRTFTRKLVAGPDTGTANLVKATGVPMDTILAHFLVTLYTDHESFMPANSPFNFKSYNFRELVSGTLVGNETAASYLPIKRITSGAQLTTGVPSSSAAYFLALPAASGSRTIHITDASGNASVDPNGRVYVVRIQ